MEPRAGKSEGRATKRFEAKSAAIVAAAADVINEQSAKGMTFADVARRVGLNTTSVTYYFKRKEDLAAACFERTLARLEEMLDAALEETTPEARVTRFVAEEFRRLARIRAGLERDVATLADLRAMEEPLRGRLIDAWQLLYAKARRFWGPQANAEMAQLIDARAHVLLENISWLPTWLTRYDVDEYPRIEARLGDLFRNGFAAPDARWSPTQLRVERRAGEAGREMFLHAATRLINLLGYRGASVEGIVA
jgi:AcrR family transcriptional regulator